MSNNPIRKFRSWLRDKHERSVEFLKLVLEYMRDKMLEDALEGMDEEFIEFVKQMNNDNKDMKLIAEIYEYSDNGKILYGVSSRLATEFDGDEIYDKTQQGEEVARLIELSDKIKETVKSYERSISSTPIADKKSATEDSTT